MWPGLGLTLLQEKCVSPLFGLWGKSSVKVRCVSKLILDNKSKETSEAGLKVAQMGSYLGYLSLRVAKTVSRMPGGAGFQLIGK